MKVFRKTIFFDRDDTINVGPNCSRAEDFQLLPGAKEALASLRQAGYLLVLITNQGGLGEDFSGKVVAKKPRLTRENLTLIFEKMNALLGPEAKPDLIKFCPHAFWYYKCKCHKPAPGMLLEAAEELGVDLSKSYMIGDRGSDILAGHAAGVTPVMVMTGTAEEKERAVPEGIAFQKFADIQEAAEWILKQNLTKNPEKKPARAKAKGRSVTNKKPK